MENGCGNGGCDKGEQCKFAHPKMCKSSMDTRKCKYKPCKAGYHLKGTIKEDNSGDRDSNDKLKSDKNVKNVKNDSTLNEQQRSFLGQLVREEIMSVLTQSQPQMNMNALNPMLMNQNMNMNSMGQNHVQNQNPMRMLFSNLLKN